MEIIKSKEKYDVIIVGSGAAGGITTKILTDAGLKVALIEAGLILTQQTLNNKLNLNQPGHLQEEDHL